MNIVTVEQMRAMEQYSVKHGVSLDQLQRNAARAIAAELERLCAVEQGFGLFLVGPGNNGRDALIAADFLMERGWRIRAYLAPKVGSEDVLERLEEGGAAIHRHADAGSLELLSRWTRDAAVVVDGLLGIGIKGAAREPMATVIATADEAAASQGVPIVAVDLPSGIDADTGEVGGQALHCTYTVSLGALKAGLLRFPAAEYTGTLLPVGIGLPAGVGDSIRRFLITDTDVGALLPARPSDSHKGSFGRVLVVGGSRDFVGAPYLVGGAAARSGCGLVTLAVPDWQRMALAPLLPEATYLPLERSDQVDAVEGNLRSIAELLPGCSSLVVGPGLGRGPAQSRLVRGVLDLRRQAGLPTVLDADALNALAGEENWWELPGPGCVLTPHPGEMSRLVGRSTAEVNADRWGVAEQSARRWGQVIVLKGAFTVVADPSGDTWINPAANSALASGGTGDVLSGLVGGLAAQGATILEAALAGVFLHSLAAQEVLAELGTDRLLAGDLLPAIPLAIRDVKSRR